MFVKRLKIDKLKALFYYLGQLKRINQMYVISYETPFTANVESHSGRK